ncbi:hypothetical protein QFZ82_000130 [Streptomyces sp. V4I23]|nr:hypothetical protein [Streptomyces sp. V4I23]
MPRTYTERMAAVAASSAPAIRSVLGDSVGRHAAPVRRKEGGAVPRSHCRTRTLPQP